MFLYHSKGASCPQHIQHHALSALGCSSSSMAPAPGSHFRGSQWPGVSDPRVDDAWEDNCCAQWVRSEQAAAPRWWNWELG